MRGRGGAQAAARFREEGEVVVYSSQERGGAAGAAADRRLERPQRQAAELGEQRRRGRG